MKRPDLEDIKTAEDIKNYVDLGDDYKFLKENKHLSKNILLLGLTGSRAYGLNKPTSDIDVRGFALESLNEMIGAEESFAQVEDAASDTVIYAARKQLKLFTDSNPSALSLLGLKPEHYFYITPFGQKVIDNKEKFLNIGAIKHFGGYCNDQFNKMQSNLISNGHNDDKKLEMLHRSFMNTLQHFNRDRKWCDGYSLEVELLNKDELLRLYPARANFYAEKFEKNSHILDQVVVSGTFNKMPCTEFKGLISSLHKIQSEYGNMNHRVRKKSIERLNKNQSELIRIYFQGMKINSEMKIQTWLDGEELQICKDLREGKYMNEAGTKATSDFYDLLNDIQKKYLETAKNTILPESYDKEFYAELLNDLYKMVIM